MPATAIAAPGAKPGNTTDRRAATRTRRADRWRRVWRLTWRRCLSGIVVLVLVSGLSFALSAVSPFDPLVSYLGAQYEHTSAAQRGELAARLGLDTPWWQAWVNWFADAAAGDWGHSVLYAQPVAQVISERLPWTLLLSVCGLAGALLIAVVVARVATLRPGGRLDTVLVTGIVALQAIPPFVVALLAVTAFAVTLRWLPSAGAFPVTGPLTVASLARHLVLPAAVLALTQCPWLVLSLHRAVTTAATSDPVRAARLRGLAEHVVFTRHTLPAALGPWLGLVGTRLPELVAGSVLVEAVFAWPGLAAAFVDAAKGLDLALLTALITATTAVVLVGSWLADVAHVLIDPRVRHDA